MLDIVFSNISGKGSKDSAVSRKIMDILLTYIKEEQAFIYPEPKKREYLYNNLTRAPSAQKSRRKSLHVHFMPDYGCAILITKEREESEINFSIVAP